MKTERTSLGERTVSTRRAKWRVGPALALGLLVAAVALPAPSFAQANIQPGGVAGARGDRILVKPNPGADLTQLNAALGTRVLSTFAAIGGLQTLELAAGADAQSLIALYQQSGLVEYAEPDFIVEASLAPNDPRYLDGSLWGLHNTGIYGGVPGADIRAPEGWDTQSTASNIIVAVIDTGARFTHEDLAANMWVNPGESGRDALGLDKSTNGMDDDGDGFIDDVHGINAILGTGIPWDDHGHGTHVSGTIGAVGNNSVGVVGVAWNVQLMACKFLDATGHGSVSDAITCIDYARKKGANIINASWGDYLTAPFNGILPDLHNNPAKSQALHDAIASARDAGILFVAACGNDGTDNDAHPLYPASYTDLDNIIAVAATDRTDTRAWFSNYGATTVALGAPGAAIFSCWNGSDSDYRYLDGTSMAAPHVAGVCALVWSYSPANTYSQIRNRVLSNTDPLPSLAGKCVSGGRLNLQKALGSTPGVTANFTASPTSGTAPLTVQFTDRSSGNITSWRWNFGDGSPTSTVQNPAHTYAAAGTFTASLNVSGLNGSTSTASQNIQVAPATDVTANFTASPSSGTAPLTVQFTDSSTGNIAGWLWNFGDSTAASTERNPTHIYLTAGTFTASLTVTGVSGSTSSKSQTIQVNNPIGLLATSSTSPGGLTQSSPTLSPATALAASSPQGGSSSSATTRNGTPMSQVGFSLRGKANETYLIQATTDLATWTVIATKQASSDGAIQFTDSDADNFSQRFYRGLRVTATIASVRSDRILVKPRAGVDLSLLHLSLGVQVLNTFSAIGNLQICQVPVGTTADQLIPIYVQSGLVEYAEADFIVQALLAPNDFRYQDGSLWGLHNIGLLGGTPGADIHAPEAWDTQSTASNVVVAVIDTGVRYTHEDLAANIWVNPADGSHGTNAIAGTTDPNDDQGHGTHVSGTIGAVGNNSVGVVGVTWRVQLMACKFLDAQGNGSISDAISCIDFARSHGANIINASWGSTTFTSSALHDAVQSARDAGIIWVAAAGNSGADNDATPLYPASYEFDNIIAVAATTRTDDLANFSNYGATNVDLGAPGASILSTGILSDSDYSYIDGSSFSAAHVSGACAIVWAHFPTDNYHQVVNRILSGVDPLPSLAGKCVTGGRLNLFKALGAAPPPPNQPVITLSAFQPDAWEVGPTNGVIRFHRTGDTSQAIQVSWTFSGTASNGVDYQQLPTTSPFPAGLADADLTITPIDDNQVESDETVIVTLAPGPAYTVGSPNSATVIIHEDNDQPPSSLTADFTANPTSGNAPLTVQFTDKSTGTITAWDWNFGDGSAHSSVQNPSHTYNSAADFTVTLTITGSGGATSSKSALIHVTTQPPNGPVITLSAFQPDAWEVGPTNGVIRFHRTGDTSQAIQVSWTFSGTAVNGVDYQQLPTSSPFPAGLADADLTITPMDDNRVESDETVIVTLAPGAGYSVGSPNSATVTIHEDNDQPPSSLTAVFTANPTSGQAPLTVQFTDKSTGPITNWDWDFGDSSAHSSVQNPSHTYSTAADFTVTLTITGSDGATNSTNAIIHVTAPPPPPPTANFTANPTSGQAPLMVQFTDQSTGTITAWNWNFGDGSAHSSVQNPSHTYNSAADFTVTLTITGSGGATSSKSALIHVTGPPPPTLTANFTANPTSGQAPLLVQFTDQSTGTITAWNWDFGDGSSHSTVQNPSHTYNSAADFTVTLTITGSGGATSSKSALIHVTGPPPPTLTANFTANPTSGQGPLLVQFTDQSTGTITAWNWDFGDGSAHSSVQNPSHTYNSVGDFTATLTITGSGGATSSKSTVIHVTAPPPPSANFTANPTSGQAPLTVQFTDQSTGTVTAWDWNFGDGSAHSSIQNPSHTYTSAGDFTVTLIVSCFGNPNSSKSMVIHVTAPPPPPSASFTANPTSGQAPLMVQFTDQSTGTVTAWNWNFGDGSAHSSVQNPSHTYTSAGDFTATLTVTGGGATSSKSVIIHVTAPPPPPSASFTANPTSGQAALTVQFTDQSSGTVTAWNWNFGDGSAHSSVQNPSHIYTSAGDFTATLTVTGSGGAMSSASVVIHVTAPPPPPSASFTANPTSGQAALTVQFTDQSSGTITAWNWNFGDGSAHSSVQNPSHTYTSAGDFTATLTVTGSGGATSSASVVIHVTAPPPKPILTVSVTVSVTSEQSTTPGVCTISRTGDLSSTLTAHYTLSGTAINGVDYQTLSGSVEFAAGASEATVLIVPIDDHVLLEADELVILTLSADAAYDLGLVNSGVVTILDPL